MPWPSWRWIHVQRDTLAGHFNGVGMTELVRSEPAPHPGLGGEAAELGADAGLRPRTPAGRPVDNAEQRTHRQLGTTGDVWCGDRSVDCSFWHGLSGPHTRSRNVQPVRRSRASSRGLVHRPFRGRCGEKVCTCAGSGPRADRRRGEGRSRGRRAASGQRRPGRGGRACLCRRPGPGVAAGGAGIGGNRPLISST